MIYKDDVVKLITVLRQVIVLYQILLNLLQSERNFVSGFVIEKLVENNNEKETILLKIKMLEDARAEILESISTKNCLPVHELTMSKICEYAWEPYRTEFKTCYSTLSAIISSVKEITDINRILIDRSLNLMKDSLCLINNLTQTSPSYLSSGFIKDDGKVGHLVYTRG